MARTKIELPADIEWFIEAPFRSFPLRANGRMLAPNGRRTLNRDRGQLPRLLPLAGRKVVIAGSGPAAEAKARYSKARRRP